MKTGTTKFTAACLVLFLSILAPAQTGGNYTITQSVVAGGGGQSSTGGTFSLDGTIGQSVAGGALVGSPFSVTSGFWSFTPAAPNTSSAYEATSIASRSPSNSVPVNPATTALPGRRHANPPLRSRSRHPDAAPNTGNEFQKPTALRSLRTATHYRLGDVTQARRYASVSMRCQLRAVH